MRVTDDSFHSKPGTALVLARKAGQIVLVACAHVMDFRPVWIEMGWFIYDRIEADI